MSPPLYFFIAAPWKGETEDGVYSSRKRCRGHENKDFHEAGCSLRKEVTQHRTTARSLSIPMPRGDGHRVGRGRHWSHPSCQLGAGRPQDAGMNSSDAFAIGGAAHGHTWGPWRLGYLHLPEGLENFTQTPAHRYLQQLSCNCRNLEAANAHGGR